jgi:hypothetical protein
MPSILTDQLNINIPGAWNTAILSPGWLRQHFPEWFQEKQLEVQIAQSAGRTAPVRFKFKHFIIEPAPNRLVLRPLDTQPSSLDRVSSLGVAIFNKLQYTPIHAVGHNVHYSLEEGESFAIDEFVDDEGLDTIYNSIGFVNRGNSYRHTFGFEDHELNVTYEGSINKREVSFNFHYPVNTPEEVRNALGAFREDFVLTQEHVRVLIRGGNEYTN